MIQSWYSRGKEWKPARATFRGLPDGTRIVVDGIELGVFPETTSIEIEARENVDISMVPPEGAPKNCAAHQVDPQATQECVW